ncbi:MAG: hypothetical protein IPM61_01110 [Chlorobi bacterium]|nr:hypothetical protein [Chlorobiota bacterium]
MYNDREEDKESSLYNNGVRKLEEGLGRFTAIDPLWEKFLWQSPYVYGDNNPLSVVDPDGMQGRPKAPGGGNAYSIGPDGIPIGSGAFGSGGAGEASLASGSGLSVRPGGGTNAASAAPSGARGSVVAPTQSAAQLEARAVQIHQATSQATQNRTTVAVAEVNVNGQTTRYIASSENALRPSQRAMLSKNEVMVKGQGHAEATILQHLDRSGISARNALIAASRPICPSCAAMIEAAGAIPASTLKFVGSEAGAAAK